MLRGSGGCLDEVGARAYAVKGVVAVLIGTVGANNGEGESGLSVIDPQGLPATADRPGHKAPGAGNMIGKVRGKTLRHIVSRSRILAGDAGRIILCDSTAVTWRRPTPYGIRIGKIFAPGVVE